MAHKFLFIAAAIAAIAVSGHSVAKETETVSRKVAVADLDLTSETGAKTMLRRIRYAAARVCGEALPIAAQWTSPSYRKCVRLASSGAVGRLDAPMVTALYDGGRSIQVAKK